MMNRCNHKSTRKINGYCPSCWTRELMANPNKYRKVEEVKPVINEKKYIIPPKREPCNFTIIPGNGMNPTEIGVFHNSTLMDEDKGAGRLNTTRITSALDPQRQAGRIPRRNNGWTKNGRKPKCPKHNITVNDLGYCPECNKHVVRRFNRAGNVHTVFTYDKKPARDRFNTPETAKIYTKEDGLRTTVADLSWDEEWLHKEPIGKINFDGRVNKKGNGRSITIINFNVNRIRESESYFYGSQELPIHRVKKDLIECECGCKTSLTDMRRGEVVCPKCGLVKGKVSYTQRKTRGGTDDHDYGDD